MSTATTGQPSTIEYVAASNPLVVEFWSDVICQWCWIGSTRLNKALSQFEHAADVKIIHHAYRLMPGTTPRPVEEIIGRKMGVPPSETLAVFDRVAQIGAAEGLHYNIAGTLAGDTLLAHRLIKFAETQGRGAETWERLYKAYHSERISVFDRDSLLLLAQEVGLDRERSQAVLDSDEFSAEVDSDQDGLQQLGGNGVPFFLIGGKYGISGAQPLETFLRALRQAWDERPPNVDESAVCGPEGCSI